MNPLEWVKAGVTLVGVAIEGARIARDAYTGRDDGYRTQERIDALRAHGASNRSLDAELRAQLERERAVTKREKPPKE